MQQCFFFKFLQLVWNIHVIQISKYYKIYTSRSIAPTIVPFHRPALGSLKITILLVICVDFQFFFLQIQRSQMCTLIFFFSLHKSGKLCNAVLNYSH